MGKKKSFSISEITNNISSEIVGRGKSSGIPDIITFCESPKYLSFLDRSTPLHLYPVQKLMLKVFYRGSLGNENLKLTDEEIALCEELGLTSSNADEDAKGDVLGKYYSGELFSELVLIWGRRCVSEDATLINPKNGALETFGELWDSGERSIASWTFDEEKNKMIKVKDAEIIYQGKRNVFCLETTSGFSIEATSNHPFLTLQDGWVKLKDLKPGHHRVAICEEQPFFGNSKKISKDEAALLGYMTACHEKAVPLELFKCPKSVVREYLKALFSDDGNLSSCKIKGRKNKRVVKEFSSVCKEQARRVQLLLNKFGIIASIRVKKHNSKIIDEKGVEKRYTDGFSYIVYFSRKKYIEKFIKKIGLVGKSKFIKRAKKNIAKIDSNIKTNHLDNNPYSFYNIRDIKKVGKKRTFDLSVSDNPSKQNFVSSSFVVHNSGKDFMSSIIALYEAMRLMEVPGGDPYAYYNVAPGEPITILTIANSKSQAQIAFNMIRESLRTSPYFKDKFLKDGLASQSVRLLTPRDKEQNEGYSEKGEMLNKGSVLIEVGHSNSDTLLGKGCFVLILDEVASYKIGTKGSASGERIYAAMLPTINTYWRKESILDEDGNTKIDEKGNELYHVIYDGKIISISSPRGKEGKLWELYETDKDNPKRLTCRLPTWEVTPRDRESLRNSVSSMSDSEFEMEFGAKFSGTAGETMFDKDAVEDAFSEKVSFRELGIPGVTYFAHLDPAVNSHNYALVVVHGEHVLNQETKKSEFYIVVDHVKYWTPLPGKPVDISEVDEYLQNLRKRFHIGMITYDQWNSSSSVQKLKKKGIPAKVTPFNRKYKMQIYKELENKLNERKIVIPMHHLLKEEMLNLQRKYDAQGFKVFPKKEGDGCKTDDIVDSLAGASYILLTKKTQGLPKGKTVNTGVVPQNNNVAWKTMQGGIMGYGPGQSVSKGLERRKSWPYYKR